VILKIVDFCENGAFLDCPGCEKGAKAVLSFICEANLILVSNVCLLRFCRAIQPET
jgi:hypothetical protein